MICFYKFPCTLIHCELVNKCDPHNVLGIISQLSHCTCDTVMGRWAVVRTQCSANALRFLHYLHTTSGKSTTMLSKL